MTNGEKIKTIFPNEEMYEQTPTMTYYGMMRFDTDWWNMEYKEPTTKNDSPKYCDRNICLKNDYNNIGCEDCEVTKSQEPTTKNDLGVDCIDRVEVIDYLCKHCPDDGECFKDCDEIKHLRQMPSVTPQLSSELEKNSKKLEKRITKNDLGVDAVSRKAVLNTIRDWWKVAMMADGKPTLCDSIRDLPAVKPIRPKGHWIRVAGGSLIDDYRCDCCNHQPPIRKAGSTWGWDFTDYCPNCGADMREVKE